MVRAPRRLAPCPRALRRPGFAIQRAIGTREPDERQLEVGRAALAEILRVETGRPFRVQTPRPMAVAAAYSRESMVQPTEHGRSPHRRPAP